MNGGQIFTIILFLFIMILVALVVLLPDTSSTRKNILAGLKWLQEAGADKPPVDLSERSNFSPTAQSLCACSACRQQIGVQAIACPNCGTPNEWMHPLFKGFLDGTDRPDPPSRAYNFQCKGATINGWCNYTPIGAWVTIAVLVLLGLVFSLFNFLITILLGFGVGAVLTLYKKSETFKADLAAGTWECSNRVFWAPIREFFITKSEQLSLTTSDAKAPTCEPYHD